MFQNKNSPSLHLLSVIIYFNILKTSDCLTVYDFSLCMWSIVGYCRYVLSIELIFRTFYAYSLGLWSNCLMLKLIIDGRAWCISTWLCCLETFPKAGYFGVCYFSSCSPAVDIIPFLLLFSSLQSALSSLSLSVFYLVVICPTRCATVGRSWRKLS